MGHTRAVKPAKISGKNLLALLRKQRDEEHNGLPIQIVIGCIGKAQMLRLEMDGLIEIHPIAYQPIGSLVELTRKGMLLTTDPDNLMTEPLARTVRELWSEACAFDGLPANTGAIRFGDDNPYAAVYDRCLNALMKRTTPSEPIKPKRRKGTRGKI